MPLSCRCLLLALFVVSGAALSAQSLRHHWKFDDNATDSAGSANGTILGDAASYAPGRFGQAISLNGTNNRITASAVSLPATDYTVTAWVWWDDLGSRGAIASAQNSGNSGEVFTLSRGVSPSVDTKLFLNLLPDDKVEPDVSFVESPVGALTTGAWMHVAYTVSSTAGARIYVNGALVGTNAYRVTHTPHTNFTIGSAAAGTSDFMDGLLDEVAVFNGALSSTQINNVMSQGAQNFNADATPPAIASLKPSAVTGVYPGTALVATFNEPIALTGAGTITLTDKTDGTGTLVLNLPSPSQVSVSGSDLRITPASRLEAGTPYEVTISAGALRDVAPAQNVFAGTTAGQWTFTTSAPDSTAPVIAARFPADGALNFPTGGDIVATFDDSVVLGTGSIVIKDLADGSTTRTIPVTDTSRVSLSGKTLTLKTGSQLASDRNYAVQFSAGVVKNHSELPFAGIPATDTTTWNFRTKGKKPNVLIILGDDQAWFDYSFMRRAGVEKAAIDLNPAIYQVAKTPAIDRLADQGLAFTHGISMPVCRPALAALVTGTFSHQNHVTGNDLIGYPPSPPDEMIEARMQVMNPLPRTLFNLHGYTSFQTGKWWEGHYSNGGFTHGDSVNSLAAGTAPPQWTGGVPSWSTARHGDWGLLTGRGDYTTGNITPPHPVTYANTVKTVTDFINNQAADQPFFIWYAPFLPHSPYDPPSGLLSIYDPLIAETNETLDPSAKYYANIERHDGAVDAILDHLDAKGIADNTIVILLCDNGWLSLPNSTSYAPRSKTTVYEPGIRTPIIVRWPDRIKAGGAVSPQFVSTPVSIVDVATTILAAVDLPPSPEMQGVNLLDLAAVNARDTVFSEDHNLLISFVDDPVSSLEARTALRDGWKLILNADGTRELYCLYDTATGAPVDPHETNNIAAAHPARVQELTLAIANWFASVNNDYASWISDAALELSPSLRAFGADADGDSLPNGLEAWLGTHPGKSNQSVLQAARNGDQITFTHPRNRNPRSDLAATYEWSPNLADWYAGDGLAGPPGGAKVTMVPGGTEDSTTVTATSSVPTERIFLRLRVTQN